MSEQTQRIERIVRNLFASSFWLSGAIFLALANAVVVLVHYLSAKTSFELMNFESRKLASQPIVGRFVGALIGDAALTDFCALALALFEALAAFLFFKFLFELFDSLEQRQLAQSAGDANQGQFIAMRLRRSALLIATTLLCLAALGFFDVLLYRYRSIANTFGVEDPMQAAPRIPAWSGALGEYGDLFAMQLAKWGPFGFLAGTMLCCLFLEYAWHKGRTAAVSTLHDVIGLAAGPADNDAWNAAEYAAEGTFEEASPIATEASDAENAGAIFDPGVFDGQQNHATEASAPVGDQDPLVNVIDGGAGESIHLSEARANPARYHVDDAHLVWSRDYLNALHTDAEDDQAEAA